MNLRWFIRAHPCDPWSKTSSSFRGRVADPPYFFCHRTDRQRARLSRGAGVSTLAMSVSPTPMLRYYANGRIRWKNRMLCNTRTNWEFYAVIDGRCGPIFHDGERPTVVEKTLWVFAPECSHAWADDGRGKFHRIV